jgi:methanogenic corrinoid protein MtbC1
MTQLFGPEGALVDVVMPALAEIGTAWEEGRVSVAAEHFASGLIRSWLVSLLEASTKGDPRMIVLVGAAPNDQHEIPTLALTVLLRRRGWHAVFLGAGMPFDDLTDAIVRKRPQLVCLSASIEGSVPGLVDALLQLRCLPEAGSVILTYGGLPFKVNALLRDPLDGIATYLGDDLRGAADLASTLLEQRAASLAAASLD